MEDKTTKTAGRRFARNLADDLRQMAIDAGKLTVEIGGTLLITGALIGPCYGLHWYSEKWVEETYGIEVKQCYDECKERYRERVLSNNKRPWSDDYTRLQNDFAYNDLKECEKECRIEHGIEDVVGGEK